MFYGDCEQKETTRLLIDGVLSPPFSRRLDTSKALYFQSDGPLIKRSI